MKMTSQRQASLILIQALMLALLAIVAPSLLGQEAGEDNRTSTQEAPTPTPNSAADPNWAKKYLADDPLVAKENITLDDIRAGLESNSRRDTVIAIHFKRVNAETIAEKVNFLVEALSSEFVVVQQQAAVELQAMGELERVVSQILVGYLDGDDPSLRDAAIVGLENLTVEPAQQTDRFWAKLLEALDNSNVTVAQAAVRRLKAEGVLAVPILLNALKSKHPQSPVIAQIVSEIVSSKVAPITSPSTAAMVPMTLPTVGKGSVQSAPQHNLRDVDPENPTTITVFYGTNRELIDRPKPTWNQILPYPFVALMLVFAFFISLRGNSSTEKPHHGCLFWAVPTLMVLGIIWAAMMFRSELQQHWRSGTGPSFGSRRDAKEIVHYGTCDVSIPPKHQIGDMERPFIGPENEQEHVVLKRTEELEEESFFNQLRNTLSELPVSQKSCFVFIHGFNVDFESAARRTAQIHYDLKFAGVPIFFSWPSRANFRHYFSDRNEIEFSRYVIKQFLIDVADRVKADRIHVIAHSMGADATCRAIAEMGDRGKIFDQIILAAPDIDREVFRLQLAPRMTKTANRLTLYCSKNDLALMLSRNFNDSTRAGDSSRGALVLQDVDTIDASDIDTDLLGHSYYGDCLPLLDDVNQLLRSSTPPRDRQLRPWPVDEQLIYWTLPEQDKKPEAVENQ
jgi:esterase/lipase superfamily enzyme